MTVGSVFEGVKQLHKQGWSFGSGDLKFNRYEPPNPKQVYLSASR